MARPRPRRTPGFAGVIASDRGTTTRRLRAAVPPPEAGTTGGSRSSSIPSTAASASSSRSSQRALDVVREAGGGHLHLWVFQPTEIHDAVAHQARTAPRPRPPAHARAAAGRRKDVPLPDGITIRAFEPGTRRGRVARPQQPRVRRAPGAGRVGPRDARAPHA